MQAKKKPKNWNLNVSNFFSLFLKVDVAIFSCQLEEEIASNKKKFGRTG